MECSLIEAQQHVSQLQAVRSRLELRVHKMTQTNEMIQGESLVSALLLVIPLPKEAAVKPALCTGPWGAKELGAGPSKTETD